MSKIVGIDLGTTNSLVALVDSGIPLVIADSEGNRLTPSIVHYSANNSAPLVGHPANRLRLIRPDETVYSVKRFIGRRGSDVSGEASVTYRVKTEGGGAVTIPIHGRDYTPEEVSAEILKKLRKDAEHYTGGAVSRAVITVPAYFNDAQRNATKRAGELAGFAVERIINEPTAAALAYGLNRLHEKARIAVYDLGGGTFDLSILELTGGVFQVLSTNGNTRLGGDDIDQRVMEFLVEQIAPHIPDLKPFAPGAAATRSLQDTLPSASVLTQLSRIREAAEQAKIRLSAETEVEITLPFLTPDYSFGCTLARAQLERLARDVILRTREHCLRSLADAKLEPRELDQVILVGGQTRMPLVRQLVSEWFECADFEETRGGIRIGEDFHRGSGPQLNTSQNPDEAVALGAAIQAEILSGGFQNLLLLDVTPLSLGIETFGGLMNVIIPRNSTIPLKAGEMFTTAMDNQASMLIHVLQGERERARDNWSLGKFTLEFERAPRGAARVGVQFEIDANGILHVLARDTRTGNEKIVEMKSAVDVDDSAVQQMVEESVEHAFEDLAARRWIEAKLKAAELVNATRKALDECSSELDAGYRAELEQALAVVESSIKSESQKSGSGDVAQLKAACAQLDETSKPLAELLMDRAVETMLKKRGLLP
ncbi:MAG TPA: Hsp70 family protein [Verrucomicrobiae bacterium]|nr:Hsp70 family protein [Verrucomicrobiae bacterium]